MFATEESAQFVVALDEELKSKTIEAARFRGFRPNRYTPWLCCLPDSDAVDIDFLKSAESTQGIATSPEFLASLMSYLKSPSGLRVSMLNHLPEETSVYYNAKVERPELEEVFQDVVRLVCRASPLFCLTLDNLVQVVVPLFTDGPRPRFCFSSHEARSAIFLSIPPRSPTTRIELAFDLVHEMGHQALMRFQSADPLMTSDFDTPIFSGVRRTPRPAIHSYHAAAAIAYMLAFIEGGEGLLENTEEEVFLEEQCSLLRTGLQNSLEQLNANCEFTTTGRRILDSITTTAMV